MSPQKPSRDVFDHGEKQWRKLSGAERIAIEIAEYRKAAKLDSWSSFVEALDIPSEMYPAIMTNRPELLRLAQPRDMKADEVAVLYKLIGGLLETNAALRAHTERVAQLTDNLDAAMKSFARCALSIRQMANFKVSENADDEDEAA